MSRRYPTPPAQYEQRWANELVRVLTQQAAEQQPISGYAVSNYAPTRSLDMATATPTDIGNFVATLVADLIKTGVLSK